MEKPLIEYLRPIKKAVDARIEYCNDGETELRQFTVVPAGEKGRGDCSVFTATYQHELEKAGHTAVSCCGWVRQKRGWVYHAWVEVGMYALDCRFPGKVIMAEDGGYRQPVDPEVLAARRAGG